MIIARDSSGKALCARCGRYVKLTKDHFIPKCSRMNVDKPGNLVGICEKCNREKGNRIVLPEWYLYLKCEQRSSLYRYMRYSRSYILEQCEDEAVREVVEKL